VKKFAALLILALVACGKRGDPKPPVPVIPKATSDLVVTQRGPKVILSWSYPSLSTSGKTLASFRRVTVYRYAEQLPTPQAGRDPNSILPGDLDPTVPPPVALFSKLPQLGPAQFVKLRQRLDSIESANSPGATIGARLTYEDTPQFHTTDGRPVRLNYAIVTEGEAQSDLSNLAVIVPIDVPKAPASLTATAKPEGVVLSWSKPATTISGVDKPFISGYNIYRSSSQSDELTAPVNPAPVNATTYTDVAPYGTYSYQVTAVSTPGQPRIESDPSGSAAATYKDLLPPAQPATITALIEPKAIRLIWDAVDAPDLAGYKVYRTEGMGHTDVKDIGTIPLFTLPAGTTRAIDPKADPGIVYRYSVSAIDKNGNESTRATTDWVEVPKTP
jgi:hypothetical protein